MPELAEVEYFRKIWNPGIGKIIVSLELHPRSRVFRGVAAPELRAALPGSKLLNSQTHGKQMLFHFSGGAWLGIHLGMTGKLKLEAADFQPGKHDHLVLRQKDRCLVFSDPRLFGRIRFDRSKKEPLWWSKLPPAILSPDFTLQRLRGFHARYKRSPVKAVLLRQDLFPGIGNWMADEILWRSRLHPAKAFGTLSEEQLRTFHRELRWVYRQAMRIIGSKWGDLPDSWLFNHRWSSGGLCPKTGVELKRETIAGRTTCWSPAWQNDF